VRSVSRRAWAGFAAALLLSWTGVVAAAEAVCADAQPGAAPPAAGESRYGQGLLWRIEHEGRRSSYLFGTIHLSGEDVLDLPPEVRVAFDGSGGFVMETLPDEADLAELSKMMFYPRDGSLRALVGPGLFELAAGHLVHHGITGALADHMRPWAAYMTLSFPPQDGGQALDLYLMEQARAQGKELFGLETMLEQVEILSGMEEEQQVRMLRDTACNYEQIQREIQDMKRLWLARDLDGLVRVMNSYSDSSIASRELLERLLYARNRRMAARLQTHLRRGNVFIAVGALHLPGEEGILALLKKRGYRISAVY